MAKDKYEISLWEDYFVDSKNVEGEDTIPSHYEDRKIAIIGSDTMTSECRAIEPQLVENINGTSTFTFKMYYSYYSPEGEKYTNPFLNLLVNERKVKVLWKNKWYDFLIKNCQENSEDKSITYTCTDLFINELSKNGFNIELSDDLGNNQGSIIELARTVLEDTDWSVSSESESIKQEKEEPVYYVDTIYGFSATKDIDGSSKSITSGSHILVYYNQIQTLVGSLAAAESASGTTSIQFAYAENYITENNSQLVVNADSYTVTLYWTRPSEGLTPTINFFLSQDGQKVFSIAYEAGISNDYRATRLVQSQKSIYDPITEKYCYVYKARATQPGNYSINDEIYGFQSTEFKDPTTINNIVVNSKDFVDLSGWSGDGLALTLFPELTENNIDNYSPTALIRLNGDVGNDIKQSSVYFPEGFKKGEKYIFRYKCHSSGGDGKPLAGYITTGVDPVSNTYFSFVKNSNTVSPWVTYTVTCSKSITRAEIYDKNLKLELKASGTFWLEEAQFFQLVYNETGEIIYPGVMDTSSIVQTYYYYYNHTKYADASSEDDIEFLHGGTSDLEDVNIEPVYNGYEKIRSISIKQSNCFNILQSLAETFECWIEFNIEHENDGRTKIINGIPQKSIVIKKEIGKETGIGFVYGIDLKNIQRAVQSDQIVTKTIVSPNSNTYAKNGFCTIARSKENYPRTNFILNFDYYVSQGLLDGNKLNKDLYDPNGEIGYYYYLNQNNKQYDLYSEELTQKRNDLLKQEAFLTQYTAAESASNDQIVNLKNELTQLAGASSYAQATAFIKKNKDREQVKTRITALASLEKNVTSYTTIINSLKDAIANTEDRISELESVLKELTASTNNLNLAFYKKYSRFIQEGTWNSESYVDDDLYYLDGLSVAYTASRPRVSYTISVIRLSSLEEYKNKVFHLGDISFIQDVDFFGYTIVNRIKTPYKEKVLVSQITSYFDEPERDTFTIQNYKTQFEDLFQRITSTTQSLQYASGSYARAASTIAPNGTITAKALQATLDYNKQLVYSAQNDTIVTDSTGITVTDASNPNKQTKITSGGVIITTDGGETWKSAISGEGVGTQYLTTGAINTANINIMGGNSPLFRWDEVGLTAFDREIPSGVFRDGVTYYTKEGATYTPQTNYFKGVTYYVRGADGVYREAGDIPLTDLETYDFNVDDSRFVRFDGLGIYGAVRSDDPEEDYFFETTEEVKEKARFGLLWDGLFIKNLYSNHYVEISSSNDIQVVKKINSETEIPKVKIGKIGEDAYGLQLRDDLGRVTLETDSDDGTLLLQRVYITKPKNDGEIQRVYDVQLGVLDEGKFSPDKEFYTLEKDGTYALARDFVIGTKYYTKTDGVYTEVTEFEEGDIIKEVFNSSDNFKIYQDGEVRAEQGTFRGTIYAESGEFTGNIHASGGSIDQSLSLGEAKLWNPAPEYGNGKILEASGTVLREDGVLQLSGTSTIEGDSFTISPDLSVFNNVNVTGKISSAVFEVNKVQAVGGSMLFRPSYKIASVERGSGDNLTVHLEDSFLGEVGNYVYLLSKSDSSSLSAPILGQIVQGEPNTKDLVVTLLDSEKFDVEKDYGSLVDLGPSGSIYMGINSGPQQNANLYGEGFTVSEFNYEEGAEDYNLRTFFGNLEKLGIPGVTGYGLYGDNVYLNGSLTTYDSLNEKYSGINTLSSVSSDKFPDVTEPENTVGQAIVGKVVIGTGDTSPIVFWAGAKSSSAEDVKDAPFQVTQNGSLYAKRGYFSGTVQGSDIILGEGQGQGGSIKIYGENGTVIGQIDSHGFKLSFGGSMKDVPTAVANAEDTALDVKARADSGEFDGKNGISAFYTIIESSAGNIFKNQGINTTLTARAYYGTTEVTDDVTQWTWEKHLEDGTMDPTWSRLSTNVITLSPEDVDGHAIFYVYATYNPEGV